MFYLFNQSEPLSTKPHRSVRFCGPDGICIGKSFKKWGVPTPLNCFKNLNCFKFSKICLKFLKKMFLIPRFVLNYILNVINKLNLNILFKNVFETKTFCIQSKSFFRALEQLIAT